MARSNRMRRWGRNPRSGGARRGSHEMVNPGDGGWRGARLCGCDTGSHCECGDPQERSRRSGTTHTFDIHLQGSFLDRRNHDDRVVTSATGMLWAVSVQQLRRCCEFAALWLRGEIAAGWARLVGVQQTAQTFSFFRSPPGWP